MYSRLLITLLLICNSIIGFSNKNEVLINSPSEVNAGEEFLIIVNIPANLLQGIARLQLELPNGFEAESRQSANSKFSFENQVGKFQWLQFPKNEEVEVSLSVLTPKNIDGYYVIKANAYYLSENEPIKVNIEPKIITVKNDNSNNDMLLINEKTSFNIDDFKSEGVVCIRQVPYLKGEEVIVNLLVSKGSFNKYGKIQEKIPVGYKVANIKSQNAIFVYNEKQRIIKYLWMNMPMKDKFIVSYKLIPTNDIDENNPFLIYGNFYYADNNNTKSVEIKERGIDLQQVVKQ